MGQPQPLHQRFLAKIEFCEHGSNCEDCCWKWIAGCRHGHGQFFLRKEGPKKKRQSVKIRAELFMWILVYGSLPPKLRITQQCAEPTCVNYHHFITNRPVTNAIRTAHALEALVQAGEHP